MDGLGTRPASGAHDVIAITSPQKNGLCTKELRDKSRGARHSRFSCESLAPRDYCEIDPSPRHWKRSVYHLEKLDSVVYFLGRERGLWS